jgi:O-antigen/teichoic acid export membrane protein
MTGGLRQLLRGPFGQQAAATQLGLTVSAVCAVGASILLARGLGQAEYGRYALVFALFGLVNILGDLGVGKASILYLAEARGAGDDEAFLDQVAFLLKMTVLIGLGVTAIGLVFAPLLGRLLNPAFGVAPYARVVFLSGLAGIGHAFAAPLLAGLRRMKALAAFEIAFAVLRLGAIAAAIAAGLGLWGVVAAHVGATLVVSLAALAVYETRLAADARLPGLGRLARAAVRAPWWRPFKLGAQVTGDRQLTKLIEVLPVLVLGRLSGSTEPAGYFNLARNIIRNLGVLFLGVSKSLLPFFAELKGKGQLDRMRRNHVRATIAGGVGALVVAAVCVPLLPIALRILYGPDWEAAVTVIAYVLLGRLVADGFYTGVGSLLLVADKVRWSATLKAVSLPVGLGALVGGALLGRTMAGDPLSGAALGAAAAYSAWWIVIEGVQLAASFRMLDALALAAGNAPAPD